MQQTWSAAFGTRANEAWFFPLRAARPSLPVGCLSAARSLPVRCPPAGRRDAAAVSACMRMRAVGRGGQSAAPAAAAAAATGGRQSQARFDPWVPHWCARGGRWRAQNSPGAHRSHGAHGGRAASWEQCDGIAWGGISSRVARRRRELREVGRRCRRRRRRRCRGGAARRGHALAVVGRLDGSRRAHRSTCRRCPRDSLCVCEAHAHFDFPLEAFPVNW